MKKTITILVLLAIIAVNGVFAQTPQLFKYQAVLRDASNIIVASTPKTVVIDILQGTATGTSVYEETHSITTTAQGVINLNIGGGTVNSGVFANIPWNTNAYWVKVTVDAVVISSAPLLSVPYALNAKYAESANYTNLTNKPILFDGTWTSLSGKPTLFSGSYIDLSNKPSIPAAQVQTDWNAVSGTGVLLNKPTLATVATSGSYIDLSNKPSIPAAQVQTDWNAVSGTGVLLNKPTLATVATSGSYTDLINKPTIPAVQVQTDWNAVTGTGVLLNKPTLGTAAAANTGTSSGNVPVLDGTGKIPNALLNVTGLAYKGNYSLSGNPTVTVEASGNYYIISVAGTETGSGLTFAASDWMISNGTAWQKIDNTPIVSSVAGKTGAVVLSGADITSGTLAIANGGTAASDAAGARTNLGLGTAALVNTGTSSGNVPLLDGTGKIPSALLGLTGLAYKGNKSLSGNPTVTVEASGNYYIISVAGTETGSGLAFTAGDWMISNGTAWQKITNSSAVSSVAGKTGVVTLAGADITSGTVAVANGGTGATTLTGYIMGTGTTAMTASATIPAANISGTVAIANGGTNATTASAALTNLGAAAIASPTFTGTPAAPTATTGTNTTQLATTAFVNTAAGVHAIGDNYMGGKVFFVYDNGTHGLIAATADQSTSIKWYPGPNTSTFTNTMALALSVGSGSKNTAIIIANQGLGDGTNYAARICNEYYVTIGGVNYGDWYLPSHAELTLLYYQRAVIGGFSTGFYWSSSESSYNSAYSLYFNDGTMNGFNWKGDYKYVRAIRAF